MTEATGAMLLEEGYEQATSANTAGADVSAGAGSSAGSSGSGVPPPPPPISAPTSGGTGGGVGGTGGGIKIVTTTTTTTTKPSTGVSLSLKTTATARSSRTSVGALVGGQGLGQGLEEETQQRLREIVPLDYTEAEKQAALAPASHAEGDDDHDEEGLPKKKGSKRVSLPTYPPSPTFLPLQYAIFPPTLHLSPYLVVTGSKRVYLHPCYPPPSLPPLFLVTLPSVSLHPIPLFHFTLSCCSRW